MAYRGRTRGRVAAPKRQSFWTSLLPINITMTSTGGTVVGSLGALALAVRPFTVVRQHYEIISRSDQEAAVEHQLSAFGTCIVSEQAAGVGVTAVPTPVTDASSDLWMMHQYLASEESRLVDKALPANVYSIGSKAMRKVNDDEDFLLIAELAGASGGGVILSISGRILIKLH